ncbi:hypothetical protein BVY00_01485 [bacterium G20]|nr:hypothetical protein BVY00_01485 [bacterium G20]
MKFLKTRILVASLLTTAFGLIFGGIWFQANHPTHVTEPGQVQTSFPSPISPLVPSAYKPADHLAKQSVVRFSDDTNKQAFINTNNLSASDLKKIDELPNTYVVDRAQDQLTAAGALVAEQKIYTALLTPNDPYYPQWYTTNISAPQAWDLSTGSSSIVVADIDTGFALNHEDLTGRWAAGGKDFVNNDNDPSAGTTNPNGAGVTHGTETAGLIGATGNNGKGVASINWGVRILPLQALDDNGRGTTTDVASAVHYAVDQGVKVINMSLGAASPDPILKAELDYAQSHDVVVVAAAGNCGNPSSYFRNGCSTVGQMIYPANYPQVVAVGATDQNDTRASFSSYGPNLDVVAPGSGSIISTAWSPSNQTSLYSSSLNGTSFASPIVAGLAALYRGYKVAATATETINAITSNADKVAGMAGQSFTNEYGFGRVNAFRVLSSVTLPTTPPVPTTTPQTAPAPPTPTNVTLTAGNALHKDDYLSSSDGQSIYTLQRNGNFAFYDNFKLVWETGTQGTKADQVIMQADGNLVLYDSTNTAAWSAVWSSATDRNSGARLNMQTDGNAVINSSTGTALWSTHTMHDTSALSYVLSTGIGGIARMYPGQSIYTPDRRFRLILQSDGNLVLYSPTQALWSTATDGQQVAFLALQPDGNLVLYDRSARPLWASSTDGSGLTRLIVQPDGNLVLYDQSNIPRWNSGTGASYRVSSLISN